MLRKIKVILYTSVVTACSLLGATSFADIGSTNANSVDSLFEDYLNANSSATAATVEIRERLSNGVFVTRYRKSYGTLTNHANAVPTPLNVLMRQASVVKSIVLAAVTDLIATNRLNRDTEVFCESGETPRSGTTVNDDCVLAWSGNFSDSRYYDITVGHLVDHKSGLNNGGSGPHPNRVFDLNPTITPTIEDIISLMRSTSLVLDPGTGAFDYSNRGYDLLAYVVGKASPQGSFISYVRELAEDIGACKSDIRLASPLFIASVPNREPEYYSWDNFQGLNIFEHPNSSIAFNTYVNATDGAGSYGFIPGGGGLLLTTHATLKFSEHYHLWTDQTRSSGYLVRGGGGPGTSSIVAQGYSGNVFDFAWVINTNPNGSANDDLFSDFIDILDNISITQVSGFPAAISNSTNYETSCPDWTSTVQSSTTIEEPNHFVEQYNWKYFSVSNANQITLYNLSNDVDLYVKSGSSNPTDIDYDCRPYAGGRNQESCVLDSDTNYQIGIYGYHSGRFMLDVDYALQAENGDLSSGSIDNNQAGYTGSGFVNTNNNVGEWVTVVYTAPTADQYDISLRYANGSSARAMDVKVNNVSVGQMSGASSGAWTNWQTETLSSVSLNAGSNTIRFVALNSGGNPNIDRIDVTK